MIQHEWIRTSRPQTLSVLNSLVALVNTYFVFAMMGQEGARGAGRADVPPLTRQASLDFG